MAGGIPEGRLRELECCSQYFLLITALEVFTEECYPLDTLRKDEVYNGLNCFLVSFYLDSQMVVVSLKPGRHLNASCVKL